MCGITGVFNYREKLPVDKSLLERMNRAIRHRGPDDDGSYFMDAAGVALGHRRLSIIDLDAGGQPMANEDGKLWIVYNGEIYNFGELRRELESHGHIFRTNCDTETIVHGWEQWGVDGLPRLNGMFAFALWDETQRRLVLARDPFGIKPIYYWDDGSTLLFGSEIKAILEHPKVKRAVDIEGLDQFLTLTFVPSERTAFEGIKKLPPGFILECDERGVRTRRFYKVIPSMITGRSEADLVHELRELIEAAVRRQMISDVPVGAMLSGGVDSTTISTLMTAITGEPIDTFTVGFSGDFDENELEFARATSKQIGSRHHDLEISAAEYDEFLPRSIWSLEEPVATASTLAFFKVCELAREHVKVVLTGQGADEPFAGYPRHLAERYGGLYRTIPRPMRDGLIAPLVRALPRNEQLKRAVRSHTIGSAGARLAEVYTIFDAGLKARLYPGGPMGEAPTNGCASIDLWQADVAGLDSFTQMLYIDARFSLSDNLLLYSDKMAMAVSLEARVPFLDLDLMKFVESLPPGLKVKGRTQKYLLKKAVSKWIPDEVIRRRKIGFSTPIDRWFRSELGSTIRDRLLDPSSACAEYFNVAELERMLEDHRRGRQDYKRALFSLLTFELWHGQFIEPSSLEAVV